MTNEQHPRPGPLASESGPSAEGARRTWDVAVVGGGPAGLTAALHLAWHRRSVVVLDRGTGPLNFTPEKLWNVPGFPGTNGPAILKGLRRQAQDAGAVVERANVSRASGRIEEFRLEGDDGREWRARTLLLATGVARFHPLVDGDFRPCFAYAGKGNLYYCPDCEAPETFEKDVVVVAAGSANAAVGTGIGLTRYARSVRVLLPAGSTPTAEAVAAIDRRRVELLHGTIASLDGEHRQLRALVLADGSRVEAEAFFVSTPARGRTDLAEQLGVALSPNGANAAVASQRGDTNVPGVWVAGDLRPMTQQVAVAMGTGNVAAVMIDQYLRKKDVSRPVGLAVGGAEP